MTARRRKNTSLLLREQLAQEAARLMIDQGIRDYAAAKRKAADRLGVVNLRALPSNRQIEECLTERQRIFEPAEHPGRIRELRVLALAVMDEISSFDPRLVGPVLAGTATVNSVIDIHAFSDSVESVAQRLTESFGHIRVVERRCRISRRDYALVPALRFVAERQEVLVQVFTDVGKRQAPLSPVDLRPMKRANRSAVAALL